MENIVSIAERMVEEFKSSTNSVNHYNSRLRAHFQGDMDDITDRSPEIFVACCILEKGEWKPDQYRLFPNESAWNPAPKILDAFSGKHGDFKMAIGHYEKGYRWDICNRYKWISVLSMPRIFTKLFRWEYEGDGCFKPQLIDTFHILGIEIPKKEFSVYLDNPYIAGIDSGMCSLPTQIGWWSYDFSGYGSLIQKPFEREIDNDFIYEHIRQIGYLAKDISNAGVNSADKIFAKKFLLERVLPFFSNGIGVEVADGAYRGRSLNMKRGSENHRKVYPKKIEDLETFAGLGTFIVHWI